MEAIGGHRRNKLPPASVNFSGGTGPIDPRVFGLVKAAYAVNDALDLLSIGRTSLYAAVRRGELHPVKFGKKTLFYASDLAASLLALSQSSPSCKNSVLNDPCVKVAIRYICVCHFDIS